MDIRSCIEHTNLSPLLTVAHIDQLVAEAIEHNFFGVCVPPFWVKRAKREIGKSNVALITVVGFPFGYQMTETKVGEIHLAIDNGADEIDMVWNISSFKSGMPWAKIELAKCSKLVHDKGKLLKIIIETSYLSDSEIISACKMCADAGADFVKTSTGHATGGANEKTVLLMRNSLPASVGIKASGGIKTYDQVLRLLEAGAERIGTSSAITIVKQIN